MDQQAVDQINDAVAEPAPTLPFPVSNEVKLYRGIYQTDIEKWHDVALVRELTGADEEYLAGVESRKKNLTFTQYMNELLSRAVLSIGDLDISDHPEALGKLILADRDLLFMGIVKATYGRTREFQVMCPVESCSTRNDIEINLDEDFPMAEPEFDVKAPRIVTLKYENVEVRLPNADDIDATSNMKTAAELNTSLISRCVVRDDSLSDGDNVEWARNLNTNDRKKLVEAILNVEIGPDLEGVKAHCSECGEEMRIPISWVGLLLG